jgi:UDP-N-acetylglucosamine 4,6-dehydratase
MGQDQEEKILVTGGTGFLGEKLIEALVHDQTNIRVLARNEGKLMLLKERFPQIEIFPGDVSNPFDVHQACKGITAVFHLAAFKHVAMAEDFALECTRSNVVGTVNILEESVRNRFKFVVGISTDKAAQVNGVYGATKFLKEKLFTQYEKLNPHTQYRIVRYGNVIYSTGSVLVKWKKLLSEGRQVIVTDPEATRFFWTREQAIELIFDCLQNATDTSPWVPEMKTMRMGDLLEAMAEKYLPAGKELDIKCIGIQAGENLHEKILEDGLYSNEVEQFTVEEIIGMI